MKTRLEIFDDSAELYDQVRPDYPPALFQAIREYSGIPNQGSILEIGCGTGQATRSLANDGFKITAVEAGARLAALAASNFKKNRAVQIFNAYFEEWPLPAHPFDVVLSATAFHHVEPKIRFEKPAKALQSQGTIALFWNWPGAWEQGLRDQIQRVYENFLPEEAKNFDQSPIETRAETTRQSLEAEASNWFGPFSTKIFPWVPAYTSETYLKLLETYSGGHHFLEGERKAEFYEAISAVIEKQGGSIQTPLESVLLLAKKK